MNTIKEKYFIHSAECHEVKAFNGNVLTKDGEIVWLGWSEGFPSCCREKNHAKHFSERLTFDLAEKWDGKPWYYRLKPGTLRCLKIERTTVVSTSEQEVEIGPRRPSRRHACRAGKAQ